MLNTFISAFNAIMPMCLLIAFGFYLKKNGFLNEDFTRQANRLVFQYLLPIMLFMNVYKIESITEISWDIVLYTVIMTVVVFFIGMVFTPRITKDPRRQGVVLQGFFRSNTTVIGVSLSEYLGGAAAVAVASVVSAFAIPTLNTLAVLALAMYTGKNGQKPDIRSILKNIITNPLIDAIAAALFLLVVRYWQATAFGAVVFSLKGNLKFLYSGLNSLAVSASPLAMLVLGTQFSMSDAGDMKKEIIHTTLWRLVIVPGIVIGLAVFLSAYTDLFNFGPAEYPALIAMFATPAAISSAVMAQQMGADGPLAAQLVVWTSLFAIVTLFVIVCVLMSMGLLCL